MNNYAIFDDATGRCLQTCGATDLEHAATAALPGQTAVEVGTAFSGLNAYLKEGKVLYRGGTPSKNHTFNWQTKQWEDPRTLQDHQKAKWTEIKQARTQAEYAGFTWDGSTFDSDATSQNRITGAVTLAQMSAAFSIEWILKDNTTRTLNQAGMLQVGAALGAHVAMQFARGVLLRGRIEAATTREMVEAVGW